MDNKLRIWNVGFEELAKLSFEVIINNNKKKKKKKKVNLSVDITQ